MKPDNAKTFAARGKLYARRVRWQEATADLDNAIDLDPTDHFIWYQLAPLRLYTGDVEGYRRHCRQMLQRFGEPNDATIARRTAQACQLMADAVEDPHVPSVLAEFAMKEAATSPWSPVVRGEAHYRVEEFGQAVEHLREVPQ